MHHSGVVCSTLCGAYSTKTYLVLWALATNTTSTSTTPVHCSALCSVWEDLSLSFSCLEERLELLHLSVCHSLLFTLFTLFTSFSSVTTNTSKCWPSTAKWFPCYQLFQILSSFSLLVIQLSASGSLLNSSGFPKQILWNQILLDHFDRFQSILPKLSSPRWWRWMWCSISWLGRWAARRWPQLGTSGNSWLLMILQNNATLHKLHKQTNRQTNEQTNKHKFEFNATNRLSIGKL